MIDDIIPLASAFGRQHRDDWLALVDKSLKGRALESIASKTRDGITVQALYRAEDAVAAPVRAQAGDPARPWELRTEVRHPDPSRANAEILKDLEGGGASVVLRLDPTGRNGVAIGSQADLGKALSGVLLDLAPVALDAGFSGPEAADWLAALAKNAPAAPLGLNLDPLSALAIAGASPGPIDSHVVAAATTAVRLSRAYPKAALFMASGRAAHEAGATEAQELAFAAAAGLTYAKALTRAGLAVDEAFARITLSVAVDGEYFLGVAKIRALRLVWARIVAATGASATAVIEARSSRRMLARYDAWTNLIRLAAAGFAGAVGGADIVTLGAFTDAAGLPTAFARRQARNTQLILMEESHLGRVADPAGGAWFLEALTDRLARTAWAKFQAIEAAGGLAAALTSGQIAGDIEEAAQARAGAIARRKEGLIGVSLYPALSETPSEVEAADPAQFATAAPDPRKPGPDSQCPPLVPSRLAEPFERLRDAAAARAEKPKVYLATLGEPADYAARVAFVQNLFAAGGIEPHVGSAETYRGTKALVVLCSSDAVYAEEAQAAARDLKVRGTKRLYLAGKPGELEAVLTAAGVDEFIHAGVDALDVLGRALEAA